LAYPDWEVKFDMDKAAVGYVAPRGEGGFQYVPASYQMMLNG